MVDEVRHADRAGPVETADLDVAELAVEPGSAGRGLGKHPRAIGAGVDHELRRHARDHRGDAVAAAADEIAGAWIAQAGIGASVSEP